MEGRAQHSPSPDGQPQSPQRPLSGGQSEHVEAFQSQWHPEPSQGSTRSPYHPAGPPHAGPFSPHVQVQDEVDLADYRQSNGGPNSALMGDQRDTVFDRLEPTVVAAEEAFQKYSAKAKWASYAVNGAMFAQIVVNALVTGLSAAPSNRSAQIGVAAMGAIGTILASFLVHIRGTQEPERSATHAQNLERFIRELKAFREDEKKSTDRKWDPNVTAFREKFDYLQTAVHQSKNGQPMSAAPQSTMGNLKV